MKVRAGHCFVINDILYVIINSARFYLTLVDTTTWNRWEDVNYWELSIDEVLELILAENPDVKVEFKGVYNENRF